MDYLEIAQDDNSFLNNLFEDREQLQFKIYLHNAQYLKCYKSNHEEPQSNQSVLVWNSTWYNPNAMAEW